MLGFGEAIWISTRPGHVNRWGVFRYFINSLDIFARSILVLLSLLQ